MNSTSRKVQWTVWGGLALIILTIGVVFLSTQIKARISPLPILGRVTDFHLTNQLGGVVSLATLRGKVWVADIIFTRCPGPCREMTRRMKELHAALPASERLKLITLTTDPGFDTPTVLKSYGEQFGAPSDRWWFLTGAKDEIARLAIDGLKLTALEKTPEVRTNANDLFIHSTYFIVVDQSGRLRTVIEAMNLGAQKEAVQAIVGLLGEKNP
ncbi:MAG: SCO family protein [Pedosphaera sp.]|nr:SCO family protein [Pedosphaera sp.]